jgi:hypothetical protein
LSGRSKTQHCAKHRKLDAAGVEEATVRCDGTIHDFGLFSALANDAPTKAAIRQLASELKARLQQ